MENAIVKILSRIDAKNLPVVPKILLDLMSAIQNEDVNIDSLVKMIGQDVSLSASILSAANSSYYRQRGEVTDLKRMIVVLGLSPVSTLVMTRAVQQFFAGIPHSQQHSLEIIWYRSIYCAHLAWKLARLIGYEFPDEVYLAGLVHRLGQLVLMQCYPEAYSAFLAKPISTDHYAAEKQSFGLNHFEIGAYLIDGWHLQSLIADAVRYQNEALDTVADSAGIVKILNLAVKLSNVNSSNKHFVFEEVHKSLGLNHALIESLLEDVKPLVAKSAGSLGIAITRSDENRVNNVTTNAQRDVIQNGIGEQVKNLAFTAAVQVPLEMSGEVNKLVANIRRDMSVLFGFEVASLFLYRKETNTLEGLAGESQGETLWSTMSVSAQNNASLLARAWQSRRILHSFNINKQGIASLIDRQICQLMSVENVLLLPMIHQEAVIGVIAAGLQRSDVKRIKLNLGFINIYLAEAARILKRSVGNTADVAVDTSVWQTKFAMHARKLSYEINNPLTIINNYLYLLSLKLDDSQTEQISAIQTEIDRVAVITLGLADLNFETINNSFDDFNLNGLIMDLIKLFEAGVFKTHMIKGHLSLDTGIQPIANQKEKIKQILTNLIKNAVEAMPAGGEIFIATKDNVERDGNSFIEVTIRDNGPGIPTEVMANLFRPGHSTKGKRFAGLGLAICKNLIDDLKGIILCNSSAGSGTTFLLYFPKIS